MEALQNFIGNHLTTHLELLDADTISEYILTMLTINENPCQIPESIESIKEYLEELNENGSDNDAFLNQLQERYTLHLNDSLEQIKVEDEMLKLKIQGTRLIKPSPCNIIQLLIEKEIEVLKQDTEIVPLIKKQLTPEEKRKRQLLLDNYGYETEDLVENDEGELEYPCADQPEQICKKTHGFYHVF